MHFLYIAIAKLQYFFPVTSANFVSYAYRRFTAARRDCRTQQVASARADPTKCELFNRIGSCTRVKRPGSSTPARMSSTPLVLCDKASSTIAVGPQWRMIVSPGRRGSVRRPVALAEYDLPLNSRAAGSERFKWQSVDEDDYKIGNRRGVTRRSSSMHIILAVWTDSHWPAPILGRDRPTDLGCLFVRQPRQLHAPRRREKPRPSGAAASTSQPASQPAAPSPCSNSSNALEHKRDRDYSQGARVLQGVPFKSVAHGRVRYTV